MNRREWLSVKPKEIYTVVARGGLEARGHMKGDCEMRREAGVE